MSSQESHKMFGRVSDCAAAEPATKVSSAIAKHMAKALDDVHRSLESAGCIRILSFLEIKVCGFVTCAALPTT